jgi:hypothetical protein
MPGPTRRSWMVSIGQAAAGLGISGALDGGVENTAELPPGVYMPSQEHLSHALMSAERFHPIPAGCPTDYVRPRDGPYEPAFFSEADFMVLRRVVKLLLGEDERVGDETSEEVAEWIDLRVASANAVRDAAERVDPLYRALAQAYDAGEWKRLQQSDPVKICTEGLAWMASAAQARHAAGFASLSMEQQIELLESISELRPDPRSENAGTRCFAYVKAETIRGFYTSVAGLKELDYKGNAFYVRSPGCDMK